MGDLDDDEAFDAAQAIHEQRMADDPEHDRSPCVCCCMDCDDLHLGDRFELVDGRDSG